MDPQLFDLELDLLRLQNLFRMDEKGLGDRLLDVATVGIILATRAQTDPDGVPWPNLSKSYQVWKDHVAPNAPIGVLYGHMLQPQQIRGVRSIDPKACRMTYGTDLKARVEAVKFQEGGLVTGTNQPQRPFYAFTSLAQMGANTILDSHFATFRIY